MLKQQYFICYYVVIDPSYTTKMKWLWLYWEKKHKTIYNKSKRQLLIKNEEILDTKIFIIFNHSKFKYKKQKFISNFLLLIYLVTHI